MSHAELSAIPVDRRHAEGDRTPHMLEERIRQLEQQLLAMTAQAHRDPLTGLLNRRGFETAYRIIDGQAIRTDSPIACVAIDLDDFKAINDELGHLAGDAALQAFAVRLTACCRRQDVCARFGGDEFILLLPGTNSDQARSLVERIRDPENVLECSSLTSYQISFSAGIAHSVAQIPQVELLAAADRALGEAKKAGKKRTVSIAV